MSTNSASAAGTEKGQDRIGADLQLYSQYVAPVQDH